MLLSCLVLGSAGAQSIDEPGVHLVDPRAARESENAQERKPPAGGVPGRGYCVARSGSDARADNCVSAPARDARQDNLEAAKRSGVEVGPHAPDRPPRRPAQRNH